MPTASKDAAGWLVNYTIAGTGEKTISFKTENKFIDADARVVITTPAASNPTLSLSDNSTTLTMGTATSGVYSPTATLTGNASIATGGWISADDYTVSDTNVVVGKVNQSTMLNGASPITSGATITPGPSDQTITITEGYNAARTLVIGSASSSSTGAVTSGSATISSVSYAFNSSTGKFDITGSADVSAPTVNTAGYISGTIGTLSANTDGAQLSSTVNKIAIQANLSGTGTKAPTITKNSNTNIAEAGAATTTQPVSGYYVAVSSAANTGTVAATATVTSAGYGTTTSGQYTTTPSSNLTVGAAASAVTYIPIDGATFANTATSGTTYTDISTSAPVLVSGDYLYINAGYVANSKISLAKLVPDGASATLTGSYILSGYSAYDNNGALVAGTIGTYDGNYTIV